MLHDTLTGYKAKLPHQDNIACIGNACVVADCVVKYILKLGAGLILPIHTPADAYAFFF